MLSDTKPACIGWCRLLNHDQDSSNLWCIIVANLWTEVARRHGFVHACIREMFMCVAFSMVLSLSTGCRRYADSWILHDTSHWKCCLPRHLSMLLFMWKQYNNQAKLIRESSLQSDLMFCVVMAPTEGLVLPSLEFLACHCKNLLGWNEMPLFVAYDSSVHNSQDIYMCSDSVGGVGDMLCLLMYQ